MSEQMGRRTFLTRTTTTLASGLAVGAFSADTARASTEEPIRLGIIGCGGMMMTHVSGLVRRKSSVSFAYLCDPDPRHLETFADVVADFQKHPPRQVADFHRVVNDPDVDAVIIATPHHWHIPIALPALQAGKDVYVEKPASHCFHEGRLLVETAKQNGRIVQHGTQMRSSQVTFEAGKVLESGLLGEILVSKAWNVQDQGYKKPVPDGEPPAGVDYDRWLGPAPKRPFNANRFHRTWRLFRDYGNGDIGDDGAHDLDMARFGLGVITHPVRITAHGSNVRPPGYREYPDNMMVAYEYQDGRTLIYEDRQYTPYRQHGFDSGNAFYGTEGYMIFSRRGYFQTYLGSKEEKGPGMSGTGRVGAPAPAHMENFLACVRSREQNHAPAEIAHLSCSLIHLGEAAYRSRTVLEFDPETEQITNSDAAQHMLTKQYREPYGLPETL